MSDWKLQAEVLFFIDRLAICEIAETVGKARETVSRFITSRVGYENEMARRKNFNAANRREYQRQWVKGKRETHRYSQICGESMRREHELSALILSKERFL